MGYSFPNLDINKTNGKRLRVIHNGKVYDISNFADRHPGGREVLEQNNGKDIEEIMQSKEMHVHSKAAYQILDRYYVGTVESSKDQAFLSHEIVPPREAEYYKNDLVDWDKPILSQVLHLGEDYFEWTHQPVDRALRLFESDFFEFFSKAPWYVVPIIWLPLILYMLWCSYTHLEQSSELWPEQDALRTEFGMYSIPFLFFVGILFWTLLEYVIHRWIFHLQPPTKWPSLIVLHFSLHGQHHKSPMDSMRLVFPPLPASIFAIAFYLLCTSIFPVGMAQSVFAGIVFGYLTYDLTHYYVHHGKPFFTYLQNLKTYHALHHYEHQDLGFGISSKLWDYPFGTLIPEDQKEKSC